MVPSEFIERILDQGYLWGLADSEMQHALVESLKYNETYVMPFWSKESGLAKICTDDWQDYKPVKITSDSFLDDWLVGMHNDLLLIGLDWDTDLSGEEYEPLDILECIEGYINGVSVE
ncbi:MAG: hypothetical protein CMK23_02755 [Porticoccaceae bacterium]|nr:hypothetical protein [Porticoccaceae bacterium]